MRGCVATDLRGGGKFNSIFLRSLFLNPTVKELLKSVYNSQRYLKNVSQFFLTRGVVKHS